MTQNIFSKQYRLLKSDDFLYLKDGVVRLRSENVLVYAKKSRLDLAHARIGISVTKKVGKAYLRNRIKRLIREHFRLSSIRFIPLDILVVVGQSLYKDKNISSLQSEKKFLTNLQFHFSHLEKKAL